MDFKEFKREIERAYRALPWYNAENQNNIDIWDWYHNKLITADERDQLMKLNKEICDKNM